VALVIRYVKRMRRVILSSVACLLLSYFSTLCHKGHDFRGKKFIEHTMCVNSLYNYFSETFLILRRIEQYIVLNAHTSSCKVPIILVIFELNLNFLDRFSKKHSNTKVNENPPSGSRVVLWNRRTDIQTRRS
jgi:hypothetical protein